MNNVPALLGAIAITVVGSVHGFVGHRWLMEQLDSVELRATALSKRLFGDRNDTWRVFGTAWHMVTVMFAASAAVLALTAFGALESRDLLRFVALLNLASLGVGAAYAGRDVAGLLRPVPVLFFVGMVATVFLAWIASNSVQSP